MAVEKVYTSSDKKTHKTEKEAQHHERFLILQEAIKKSRVRIPSTIRREDFAMVVNDILEDILKAVR